MTTLRTHEPGESDDIDLRNLATVLTDSDVELASEAAALIEAREFSRERDLVAAIDDWL